MSLVKFQDLNTEKYVLASFLNGPEYWKDIPEIWFKEEIHQKTYKEYKKILKPPYSTFPTFNIVIDKAEDNDIKLFVTELQHIEVNLKESSIKIQDLFNMYCSRKLYDIMAQVPEEMERIKIDELIRNKIATLSGLMNPYSVGSTNREFIYESAVDRWLYYKGVESGEIENTALPFHISELDKYTNGGLRKSHMMLLVASTGEFKTLTKSSLVYNSAFIDKSSTMVLTLEVPGSGDQRDYQMMIDARHSLLEFSQIVNGKLGINRSIYREKLMDIKEQQYPLYIVDIPEKATPGNLVQELELYYAKTGTYPQKVFIDYLNEMEPMESYDGGTSGKFKQLGSELRVINRVYGIRTVTSMQLNREGKKIKDGEKRDIENISESHYISNPFHVICFLHRDANGIDEATNQLHWTIRKNRYGQKNVTFTTFANAPFCYVGDKKVIYPGVEQ